MHLLQAWLARKRSLLPAPQVLTVTVADKQVEITFKRHAMARRFTLRVARDGRGFTLTLPKRARLEDARRFVLKSESWMADALSRIPARTKVADGVMIMLRGTLHQVIVPNTARGLVCHDREARTITVPGRAEHIQRRLTDWLKKEAQRDLESAARHYASQMGTSYKRITIRDQKSRWGSCSADRSLSFSWRLILAPSMVLDYVAAHEVAHLLEMNHSPRFWRLVLKHCPHTRTAKDWLKKNGAELHRL